MNTLRSLLSSPSSLGLSIHHLQLEEVKQLKNSFTIIVTSSSPSIIRGIMIDPIVIFKF
jgi:hypothetical protein